MNEIAAHTNTKTKKILIIYPGRGDDPKGFNNKYVAIGNILTEKDICVVVRIGNSSLDDASYPTMLKSRLRDSINYA